MVRSSAPSRRRSVFTVACPACGCERGFELSATVQECRDCGGIHGSCYQGDAYTYYRPYWAEGDVPPERTRYVDLTILGGDGGIRRFHGWIDRETLRIVQTG